METGRKKEQPLSQDYSKDFRNGFSFFFLVGKERKYLDNINTTKTTVLFFELKNKIESVYSSDESQRKK